MCYILVENILMKRGKSIFSNLKRKSVTRSLFGIILCIVFGIVLGILTGIFRIFGASAEGVSYAIIFSNLLVPLIEKITVPKAFGVTRVKKNKEA